MRVDGDTPQREADPTRLARADSPDPKGDVLTAKIVACGRAPDELHEAMRVVVEQNATILKQAGRIAELEAELATLRSPKP